MASHSSAAEHLGEWLPQELAAEIRGLLADSPAALSPRLSAWLACEANERGPHRDDRQRVQKRRLSEDCGAGPQLWSSHAAVAPDGQTHEGTSKWGASEEWMSRVFALLDEPEHLKNARLVSQGWAKQIISMKASISITRKILNGKEEEKQQEELLQRLDGLSRTIGRNRLSRLEALELEDLLFSRRDFSTSLASLLTAVCGGCPLLRTLELDRRGIYNENIIALQPLLPRLQCLRLSGLFDRSVDTSKIKGLLSSMSSMTDLHLDCWLDCGYGVFKCIPGELLAVLPQGLARLSIAKVEFDSIDLRDVACSKTLTDLTLRECYFNTAMGLSSLVNLKSLSILEGVTREDDLEDILATLSKLEHLCIEMPDLNFPESSATAFVQRLQDSLPLLTSLELKSLCEYSEGILVALGQLTGLTSLNLGNTFVWSEDDEIPLPPQALRHLTTLKALKHLSLNGLGLLVDEERREFLYIALPFLQCLPSLETLDVTGLEVTGLNAPLFPVQLKTLGIGRSGLPEGRETQSAALVAVAERCTGLTSIIYDQPYRHERISFQSLAAVHQKAPNLQFDIQPWYQSPVDSDGEVLMMMASLRDSLIWARPFLQLLERSVPWNTPKHPWNLHKSAEPWVAAARNVIGLCREIAAGEYVS